MMINRPKAFPGTEEEVAANRATHTYFYSMDPNEAGDERCEYCDCRPWGTTSQWPCGTHVPREDVDTETTPPVSALEILCRGAI